MRRTHGGPSGPSGAKPSKFDVGRFVAWDGEGSTEHEPTCVFPESSGCGCPHRYVLIKNSEGGELVNPDGIPTRDALGFLTSEARRLGRDATHVCFGLSYDANMILGDLRRSEVRQIWEGDRVRVLRRFKVAYRARKTLWVRDYATGSGLTWWDPFGFYQTSFVRAIVDNLGPDDPRLPLIREGKGRRDTFKTEDLPFIRRYTAAELSALVDLMRKLRTALSGAGLKLRRWDGAGAVAAALLEREGVRSHLATSPDAVREAALYAYAGGRIETLRFGYHDAVIHHADKRSAYPSAMVELPSLKRGRWRHRPRGPTLPFSVVKVRWDFRRMGDRRSILPFPFRSSGSAIYFPRKGTTWVWRPEYDAAMRWDDLARRVEVLDGWEFDEDDPRSRPFGWVPRVYAERQRLRDEGNASQHALKLGLNSSYGKVAQHVGGTVDKPPPFHQLEWAGFITSHTRASLFDAAMRAGDACITLATDGIYSTEPLPWLTYGKDLGQWERQTHRRMVIAQSGVYWLVNEPETRDRCDECGGKVNDGPIGSVRCRDPTCGWSGLVSHFRGFDEDTLDPDKILRAWRDRETTVTAASTRFVTMGRASLTDPSFLKWRRWLQEERALDVHATGKRLDRMEPAAWTRTKNPSRGLMGTDPADPFEEVSSPYSLKWAVEQGEPSAEAQEATSIR